MAKKYDCSRVLDYAHVAQRMCDFYQYGRDCRLCPLYNDEGRCRRNVDEATLESIELVQKWSDNHPEESKASKLQKLLKGTEFESVELVSYDDNGNLTVVNSGKTVDTEWWD